MPAQTQIPPAPRAASLSWLKAPVSELKAESRRLGWSLSEAELAAIAAHFRGLQREPTRGEVETLAQTWSEHCKHKTLGGPIRYREGKTVRRFKNLLGETVFAATRKLKKPWCLSVFEDNAGIVSFDKRWALAFKVETHNHPCALEPYGGAETGVGGVIRDVLGAGLGAKPVMNTDVFCFCPPDQPGPVPEGSLHPRRTVAGVVAGVRDYGNRMGIPTAAGAVWFDEGYRSNPLVFCGTLGLMPLWAVKKEVRPGDLIVAVGGRTGRDGLHGATFSSAALDEGAPASAVQIGHALMEKRLLDGLLRCRDRRLYRAVTDCGAGGFSSAVGEMAGLVRGPQGGARVRLEKAPLKTTEIAPWEIWLSESQERMVLAVPPESLKALAAAFAEDGVEAAVLGEFTSTGRLEVNFGEERLADLELSFLHDGLPREEREAVWEPPKTLGTNGHKANGGTSPAPRAATGPTAALHWMLAHLNVCSREWIVRQYDHEVQGGTVIKPLQGLHHDGPGDATVIWPAAVTGDAEDFKGFAVAHGLNPAYGKLDPYAMALACADEALSNLACVGADVSRAAFLDNFCWGSPEDPRQLGGLVRAATGCHDAALGFEVPFISGKDSLYNETADKGGRRPIPGTLLISAVAPVADVRKAVTMDFKGPGNPVYLLGWTSDETGGSLYADWQGRPGGSVPLVELRSARDALRALSAVMPSGLVLAAHNLAEGGLAVAAAEMCFSGEVGLHVDLDEVNRTREVVGDEAILFSESPSRFLLEVSADGEKAFLRAMKGVPLARIGSTIANPVLRVAALDGTTLLEEGLAELKASWQGTLPKALGVMPPDGFPDAGRKG